MIAQRTILHLDPFGFFNFFFTFLCLVMVLGSKKSQEKNCNYQSIGLLDFKATDDAVHSLKHIRSCGAAHTYEPTSARNRPDFSCSTKKCLKNTVAPFRTPAASWTRRKSD